LLTRGWFLLWNMENGMRTCMHACMQRVREFEFSWKIQNFLHACMRMRACRSHAHMNSNSFILKNSNAHACMHATRTSTWIRILLENSKLPAHWPISNQISRTRHLWFRAAIFHVSMSARTYEKSTCVKQPKTSKQRKKSINGPKQVRKGKVHKLAKNKCTK